jgi:UTP:GlnB (protein PII) uridylyltransferase
MHVHVTCPDGEAKFWLEPAITLAQNYGLTEQQLDVVKKLVEEHADEIRLAWKKHFGG